MRHATLPLLLCLPATALAAPDTVLMMAGTGLARGGNSIVYYNISNQRIRFRAGDRLEYDLFISPDCPEMTGAPDAELDEQPPLRDRLLVDQSGIDIHPKNQVPPAKGQWYHRVFPLDTVAHRTTTEWSMVLEGDTPGRYAFFVGNLGVHHADGTWTWIYNGGPVPVGSGVRSLEGYSRKVVVRPVDRSLVTKDADIPALIQRQIAANDSEGDLQQIQHEITLVRTLASLTTGGDKYLPAVDAAQKQVDALHSGTPLSAEAVSSGIEAARKSLSGAKPLMKSYAGRIVGHGHIDPAWQWEWPEVYEVCGKTFAQALKFMDEYPGFKFSQSSSSLYRIAQDYYPDVFAKISAKVKAGQWDIVGGRVSEGDVWMLSEESHARNFLLAQRYFRKWFGKTATVGFEPDTFGHTWSMPGILKMAGIDSYYFGRGGQGKPLFWWEGPDGTRVLAFDETATGSWYDSGFTNKVLDELVPWKQATGLQSIMWVYGVGNHGGGPTREQLDIANKWRKTPYYPSVVYSTAGEFFSEARKGDLSSLPVVNESLDPHIDGAYTTHGEMKRLNRDAENWTTSAETAATLANLFGAPYPKERFDELWYDITFNQHHDTMPGTGTHEVYQQSVEQLTAVVAQSRNLAGTSVRYLANLATPVKDAALSVMVFNPLGWEHDGEVRFPWPRTSDRTEWGAYAPDGTKTPVFITSGTSRDNPAGEPMASFTARKVPGFGYKVFAIQPIRSVDSAYGKAQLSEEPEGYVLDNGLLKIQVRKDTGLITSLFDRQLDREMLAPNGAANRFEVWYEDQGPSDGWVIRNYMSHESLDGPAEVKVLHNTAGRSSLEVKRVYRGSTITQHIVLDADSTVVDLPTWIDWAEEGSRNSPNPFLKLACDVAGDGLAFRYQIPFAIDSRPATNGEVAALKSAGLSNKDGGITFLNDSKHGHTAEGNTLRMSLVRTPNRLDATSDKRAHFVRAALLPHGGLYGASEVRKGFEFNQPFIAARVPPAASGKLPLEQSFVNVKGDSVIPTVLKRAEDDPKALLVRLFEGNGAKASVNVSAQIPLEATQWVNFIEDPLSPRTPGESAAAGLEKFEIRNVLLYRK